mgnify:CR=1 FL=1
MLAVNGSHVDIVRFLLSQPNIDVNCMEIITFNHLLHLKIDVFNQICHFNGISIFFYLIKLH